MKQTLVLFFMLLSATLMNGQVLNNYGIKGGVSNANQTIYYKSNDREIIHDNRVGVYGAASLEFLNSKYFSLITDIGYCAKGSTEEILNTTVNMPEGDGTYKTYDTKFNYFTISPMLKARYETTYFIPYALLGLRMDYQLSYTSDFNYKPVEKDFHKTIWGANLGAGVEFKRKHLRVFIEGQYQHDFTKVLNMPTAPNSAGIEVNNKAIVICIGMRFYLSKKEGIK